MTTLTKADIAELLTQIPNASFNKTDAKEIVELFFEIIRNALEKGEEVRLSKFGNFKTRDKKQRPGRNPKTGEEVAITARRVVTFHAGQKLKSLVEGLAEKEK